MLFTCTPCHLLCAYGPTGTLCTFTRHYTKHPERSLPIHSVRRRRPSQPMQQNRASRKSLGKLSLQRKTPDMYLVWSSPGRAVRTDARKAPKQKTPLLCRHSCSPGRNKTGACTIRRHAGKLHVRHRSRYTTDLCAAKLRFSYIRIRKVNV